MSTMPPGYDAWKLATPPEYDACEYCGVMPDEAKSGWQPGKCTGECGLSWRDPDAESEAARDDPPQEPPEGWDARLKAETIADIERLQAASARKQKHETA